MKFREMIAIVITSIAGTTLAITPSPRTYRVVDLGPTISSIDMAKDVNDSGVVAFLQNGRAYRWSNGLLSPTAGLPSNNVPLAMNEQGQLAGVFNNRGYFWNGTTTTTLSTLANSITVASDLNDQGLIVGASFLSSIGRYRACIWENGVISQLASTPSNEDTGAGGCNSRGTIVGGGDLGPLMWKNKVATRLGILPGYGRANAYAVNENDIAVGYASFTGANSDRAMMWSGNSLVDIGRLPGDAYSEARDINDIGEVVGGSSSQSQSFTNAFYWSNGEIRSIDSMLESNPGWHIKYASSINNSGWIAGIGTSPSGQARSVLLVVVPEPSTLGTIAIGSILMMARNRRTK